MAALLFLSFYFFQAHGMMDYRDFANKEQPVPLPEFNEPRIGPPSFVYAWNQFVPPYNLTVGVLEPFPGCSAEFAHPCGIQHAIRMVTRARLEICPLLAGTLADVQLAVERINSNADEPEGTTKFGLVALMENGTILADALMPSLQGERFDGYEAAHLVAQPTLLAYTDWVTRWGGGFVPHYTRRLEQELTFGSRGDYAPVPAVIYFEACPTGERLGVAIGRKEIPAVENCNANANGFCAIQNINRLVGMNLVDYLSAPTWEAIQDQQYKTSFTNHYSVGAFYTFTYQMSWWGVPGPDRWRNPGPLRDTLGTSWAIGSSLHTGINGRNLTNVLEGWSPGEEFGLTRGDWLLSTLNNAAWHGGAWRDYFWWTPALQDHDKISLVVGVVWNGTATMMGVGTVHAPEPPAAGPCCAGWQGCSPAVSLPCSAVNCARLAAHAQAEMLKPSSEWTTLSRSLWFGSMDHWSYPANDSMWYGRTYAHPKTWPDDLYIFAFAFNGTQVADGKHPANVGQDATAFFGSPADHENFQTVATLGGGWVTYSQPDGTVRIAYTSKIAKAGQFFYLAAAFSKAWAPWDHACSSNYAEPCSERNTQVIVGAANADIISAGTTEKLMQVLGNMHDRTGRYSAAFVGDFRVSVYDATLDGLSLTNSNNEPLPITPPAALSAEARQDVLNAAMANSEEGAWTAGKHGVLQSSGTRSERAFVLKTFWKTPVNASITLYIVSVVRNEYGPPKCTADADCNGQSLCESGRCACKFGFRAHFVQDPSDCEELKPSTMTCLDVRGKDCAAGDPVNCSECSAGYYCPEGEPIVCSPGFYCPAGSRQQAACPPGTFSDRRRATSETLCSSCPAGTFSGSGQMACTVCEPGKFNNNVSQAECQNCPQSEYQPNNGSAACLPCPITHATTPILGAKDAGMCICPQGFFLPLGGDACLRCQEGMICCLGSDLAHTPRPGPQPATQEECDDRNYEHAYPLLMRRHWSDENEPLLVFDCHNEDRCPGGLPGTCATNIDMEDNPRGCARCAPGFYWNRLKCEQCALMDKSAAIFPLIPLVLSIIVPGLLYWRMGDPYTEWGNWTNTIICLSFVMLNHYQAIDILSRSGVPVTTQMAGTYEIWAFTTDLLSIFRTQCGGLTSTFATMLLKALAPLLLGVVIMLEILISRVIGKVWKKPALMMEPIRAFNVYFSILFTFFGATTSMSLELWKCKSNPRPNPNLSLASDASIICFDSDWMDLLTISIVSVLLYVVGVGVVLMRTVFIARTHFSDPTFRQRWAFLFIKYRLGTWWWGLAFLMKNFLVNLAFVITNRPVVQFILVEITIIIYLVAVQMVYPYRSIWANHLEVLCGISILMTASTMKAFTFLEEAGNVREMVGMLTSNVSYAPLVLGALYSCHLAFFGVQHRLGMRLGMEHYRKREQELEEDAALIVDSFGRLAKLGKDGCVEALRQLGEYEMMRFCEVDAILCSELGRPGHSRRQVQMSTKQTMSRSNSKMSYESSLTTTGTPKRVLELSETPESCAWMEVRKEPSWDQEYSVSLKGSATLAGASRGPHPRSSAWASRLDRETGNEDSEAMPGLSLPWAGS